MPVRSEQITALRKALNDISKAYAAGPDQAAVLDATRRFYEAMFLGAQHPIAWEIVERLNGRISRLRALTITTPSRTVTGPAQLRKIYTAIAARKPEAAAEACRQHVRSAAILALEIIKAQSNQTSPPEKRRRGSSSLSAHDEGIGDRLV